MSVIKEIMEAKATAFKSLQQNKELNLSRATAGHSEIACTAGQLQQ